MAKISVTDKAKERVQIKKNMGLKRKALLIIRVLELTALAYLVFKHL